MTEKPYLRLTSLAENEGLFCVKDFYSNGYLGAYTLVTPEGKRLFATLRDQILMTV